MAITNSCFISYRHLDNNEAYQEKIEELHRLLSAAIQFYTSKPVVLDKTRLQGGAFFNNVLAKSLCESACMVAVYIPRYFDQQESYCAREYKAMEQIEALRKISPKASQNGLIIPIIYKASQYFPQAIRSQRQFYNFEDYTTGNKKLAKSNEVTKKIDDIARYINDRITELDRLKADPCKICTGFTFPTEAAVRPFLRKITVYNPGFPR